MHLKYVYNCRKDEELVRLLRSYAKQISINAMKKLELRFYGLAKYIYYSILLNDAKTVVHIACPIPGRNKGCVNG